MEAGQVLLFTGGVSCGSAAVYVRLLHCGSIAAVCVWCMPDMRFCCGVLYLVHVRYTVLLRRFVFDHACCLPPVRQTGRLAGCCVPIPPGRDRHSCVLVMLARLSAFVGTRNWSARRCAFCRRACPRFTLGDAVLLRRFALGSRPVYGSIAAFCVRSRLLFVF